MPSKSPSRKSPSRSSRSRSRSRGRSKSPSRRKAKSSPSPSRKSPARTTSATKVVKTPTTPTRSSARIAALEVERQEEKEKKEELEELKKPEKESPKKKPKNEPKSQSKFLSGVKNVLCGPILMIGATLLLPLFVLTLTVACGKSKCTIKEFPQINTDIKKYYNPKVVGVFLGYVALQVILAILPFGRIVDGPQRKGLRRLKYKCNAIVSTMVTLAVFAVMTYMKLPVSYFYTHLLQFLATAFAFAVILSLYFFIRSRNIPLSAQSVSGNTGSFFNDFFIGREVNPRLGDFDFKTFLWTRIMLMGWMLLNFSMFVYDYQKNGEVNLPASFVIGFQTLYILSLLYFEEFMLSSRDIYDPVGYAATVLCCTAPFIYNFPVRFLIQHQLSWNIYYLIGISLLNAVGFLMMFGSLAQKDHFRKNPHDPALAHLERIPTANGKGLLIGGWWALSRKPNYLGDLIQAVCWTVLCGFEYALPYFFPLMLLLLFLDRQHRDEAECRVKHGAAWDRYCERVKSRIIPHIY